MYMATHGIGHKAAPSHSVSLKFPRVALYGMALREGVTVALQNVCPKRRVDWSWSLFT